MGYAESTAVYQLELQDPVELKLPAEQPHQQALMIAL